MAVDAFTLLVVHQKWHLAYKKCLSLLSLKVFIGRSLGETGLTYGELTDRQMNDHGNIVWLS